MSETSLQTVQENTELVQDTYAAFSRGDMIAVMGAFMPDIEWNAPDVLPHGAQGRGIQEVGQFFHGLANTWDSFTLEIDDLVASGNRVCAIGKARGVLQGKKTGYGFVHVWTVRDGLMTRFDEYVDPEPAIYAS